MKDFIRHIDKAEVVKLNEQINYQEGQIVSKTLSQNEYVSLTLFAFDKNEEISTHESKGDAMLTCIEGMCEITIDDKRYTLVEGETIVMPANHPHAVFAKEKFKMFLVVIF